MFAWYLVTGSKKNYALFQDPNGMLQSLMPNILRKTTHWKPSWGGYVKQRRGEGCRCPNGCMTSGAPGTMGSWPASSKAVGSIRPMFLWFCSPSIIHWSNKDCQSHPAIAFQNHISPCRTDSSSTSRGPWPKRIQRFPTWRPGGIPRTTWQRCWNGMRPFHAICWVRTKKLFLHGYPISNSIPWFTVCSTHGCGYIFSSWGRKLLVLSSAVSRIPNIWSGRHYMMSRYELHINPCVT